MMVENFFFSYLFTMLTIIFIVTVICISEYHDDKYRKYRFGREEDVDMLKARLNKKLSEKLNEKKLTNALTEQELRKILDTEIEDKLFISELNDKLNGKLGEEVVKKVTERLMVRDKRIKELGKRVRNK